MYKMIIDKLKDDKIASIFTLVLLVLTAVVDDAIDGSGSVLLFVFLCVCHHFGWRIYNAENSNRRIELNSHMLIAASWLIALMICLLVVKGVMGLFTISSILFVDWAILLVMLISFSIAFPICTRLFRVELEWDVYRNEMTFIATAFTFFSFLALLMDGDAAFRSEYGDVTKYMGTCACVADAILTAIFDICHLYFKK